MEVVMPLSEHEQRMLAEMEKQLHEDPQFADSLREVDAAGRFSTRNIALGLLTAVVGLVLVLVGISLSPSPVLGITVGIVGFVLMCLGVYLALNKSKGGAPLAQGGGTEAGGPRPSSNYMQRLEQQWEDRRHGDAS